MLTMDVFYALPVGPVWLWRSPRDGGGIGTAFCHLTLVFIPPMMPASPDRDELKVRALDYIDAARATGAGTIKIIRYHVLAVFWGRWFSTRPSSGQRQHVFWLRACPFSGRRPSAGALLGLMLSSCGIDLVLPFVLRLPGSASLCHRDHLQPGQRLVAGREWIPISYCHQRCA